MLFRGISRDISRKMFSLENAFSLLIFPTMLFNDGWRNSFVFPIIRPCNNRFHDSLQHIAFAVFERRVKYCHSLWLRIFIATIEYFDTVKIMLYTKKNV